ncbi:hypothetical protein WICPIJ_003147 [Wickerhamomyces pijperi]|uniref:Uncharacterized protein n=1 Tax=Wickerhamomyces pijperi TaxID=599730 RepID=A0A9P8QAG1_WICPI|nr:hypothetical protein WICPIJ_003147 [Wickerhamomyces pijperi]
MSILSISEFMENSTILDPVTEDKYLTKSVLPELEGPVKIKGQLLAKAKKQDSTTSTLVCKWFKLWLGDNSKSWDLATMAFLDWMKFSPMLNTESDKGLVDSKTSSMIFLA